MSKYAVRFWSTLLLCIVIPALSSAADYTKARALMIDEIADDVRRTSDYLNKQALNEKVLKAMAEVPRHEFVPENNRDAAYQNRPLPIGYGQTISQPYIVAVMTDFLQPKPPDVVFELGTGSGYQAAILSKLVAHVYTMEIVEELAARARNTLQTLGYENVTVQLDDGYNGWPEHAPFDAIIVTAAGDHIPPPLLQQLKPGGRMIIPIGDRFFTQQLLLVEKQPNGAIKTREVLPVRFVPLTGNH